MLINDVLFVKRFTVQIEFIIAVYYKNDGNSGLVFNINPLFDNEMAARHVYEHISEFDPNKSSGESLQIQSLSKYNVIFQEKTKSLSDRQPSIGDVTRQLIQ